MEREPRKLTSTLKSVLAASGALLLASVAIPVNAETVVVTAGHMIDVAKGITLDEPVVVTTDGRIVSVMTGNPLASVKLL